MKLVRFWKAVGGYTYCVLWKGRWMYAGNGPDYARAFHAYFERAGLRTERVPGIPQTIATHFRTLASLQAGLPLWPVDVSQSEPAPR